MKTKALQLRDIMRARDLDELKRTLQENFEALRILLDGLTGERLEPWTPVLRDGSVPMTGTLKVEDGIEIGTTTKKVTLSANTEGQFVYADNAGSTKRPVTSVILREDKTSQRALSTVYTNNTGHDLGVTVQVQLST